MARDLPRTSLQIGFLSCLHAYAVQVEKSACRSPPVSTMVPDRGPCTAKRTHMVVGGLGWSWLFP